MSKRRLSKNQRRRVDASRKHRELANSQSASTDTIDTANLGPSESGTVIALFGAQALIEDEAQSLQQRCYLRANLSIVCGDKVIWRRGDENGVVESREDRKNELLRPDSYGNLKTVAANVSQLAITIAPLPEAFVNLIDRYLIVARLHTIKPLLIINKSDLNANRDKLVDIEELYTSLGIQVIRTSCKSGTGIDELKSNLRENCTVFVGQSGVGKSSLIDHLLPDAEIKIGKLSEASAKGRHTTTQANLYHFPFGGDCIDSPGIREFGLWHLQANQVIEGFPDLAEFSQHCKFRDCAHNTDAGCAIQAAIESRELDRRRLESYQSILEQLTDVTIKKTSN